MNSATEKAISALEAAVVAASPLPWGQWPRARLDVYSTMYGDKESIATFEDDLPVGDGDTDEDDDREEARALAEANAALTVAAVNLSAPLAAVARAAMNYVKNRTNYDALESALDALEAAAEGVAS